MGTKHFSDSELACKCGCGKQAMDPVFLIALESLRVAYGKPMAITSGYRCPAHNAAESHTGTDGPHTTGKAVDVRVSGADALRLVGLAIQLGFTGVGVSQKGDRARRFIHLDTIQPEDGPRPAFWSY